MDGASFLALAATAGSTAAGSAGRFDTGFFFAVAPGISVVGESPWLGASRDSTSNELRSPSSQRSLSIVMNPGESTFKSSIFDVMSHARNDFSTLSKPSAFLMTTRRRRASARNFSLAAGVWSAANLSSIFLIRVPTGKGGYASSVSVGDASGRGGVAAAALPVASWVSTKESLSIWSSTSPRRKAGNFVSSIFSASVRLFP